MPFRITDQPIDPAALSERLKDEGAGAVVTFEGRVRDENDGKRVIRLEYEAHASLAEREGARIIDEARDRFPVLAAFCVHRTGSLGLGDVAVWVGVSAAHRGAAFDACRYIIDQTKARVPVWKKEHYDGGATEWLNASAPPGPEEP